ncbi:MAG: NAD(P)/FAD-dependent oxidoreductase [Candidatus Eremiobacteraeota bacterium]|nr:NAD(P)/FAD-dependent oxidoreductase [Candidatus Eremiobacteraeota bacterium]
MKRIVILGGGFAAIATAQRLEKLLRPGEAQIVLIGRENFSLFTPMLPEVSSGALDIRHIVTPIRSQLRQSQFILADVTGVDLVEHSVAFTHVLSGEASTIAYDQLVLALGSVTSTFGLPGVAERVFALKTLEDAGILRNRFVWLLESADSEPHSASRARLLTIVIVGGGFTGVETAGEVVELFHNVAHFYPNVAKADIRVALVEGGPTLLPNLPDKMGKYSRRALEKRGVEVFLGDGVKSADDDGLVFASGKRIETKTIVWSAGVKPSPMLAATSLPHGKGGAVVVNADMSVPTHPGVWAIGDCAAIPSPNGKLYPPTAQHAIREGPILAGNIVAQLRGKPTVPFKYSSLGMMASLGGRKAVAQLPGDRVLTGFLAWFLWRTYYLSRLPGLDRKLRVAFDWTLELLFPRDISELRIYTRRAQSSAAADAGLKPRETQAFAEGSRDGTSGTD